METTKGNENIWDFKVDLSNCRIRKELVAYQALLDHGSKLSAEDIENFDLDKLDPAVKLPIIYAHLLLTDWAELNDDDTPTFKEFVTSFNHPDLAKEGFYAGLEKQDKDKPVNLGILPGRLPAVAIPKIPGFSPAVGLSLPGAANMALDLMGMTADEVREQVTQAAKEKVRTSLKERFRFRGRGRGVESVSGKQGDDDGNSKMGYSGGSAYNPTGLSLNNKPMRVSFTTGITVAGEPKFYLDGKEESSPLILKQGTPGLVNGSDDSTHEFFNAQVYAWLSGPVTNAWITKIQSKVVWTNQIKNIITNANIVKYMNYVAFALYTYYFYSSVIAYTDDPRNRNQGMYELRSKITASDYIELSLLRLNIIQSLVPPFLIRMCHYFSGNFKQSMDPGAPLIKLLPWPMEPSANSNQMVGVAGKITIAGGTDQYTMLEYANRLMRDPIVRNITSVLARSYPSWMDQEPLGYESLPEYDSDFCTFFSNMSYHTLMQGHNNVTLPEVSATDDVICFNLFSDAPDGWITSMLSIKDTSTSRQGPGLCNPVIPNLTDDKLVSTVSTVTQGSAKRSTEFIYTTAAGTTGWWPTAISPDFVQLVNNTYTGDYSSSTSRKFQRYGTGRLNFVNQQNIIPRVMQMLELMYTSDIDSIVSTIGSGGAKRTESKGKGKRTRGRGKSKFTDTKVDVDIKD